MGGALYSFATWECGRALDLVVLALDCEELGARAAADRLLARAAAVAGRDGLRCLVSYRALAGLAEGSREGEPAEAGVQAIAGILDRLPADLTRNPLIPSGGSACTRTSSTTAAGGPCRDHSTRRSTSPAAPSKTASTSPSGRFRTQPLTPCRSAIRRQVSRKNTPCTRPEISSR